MCISEPAEGRAASPGPPRVSVHTGSSRVGSGEFGSLYRAVPRSSRQTLPYTELPAERPKFFTSPHHAGTRGEKINTICLREASGGRGPSAAGEEPSGLPGLAACHFSTRGRAGSGEVNPVPYTEQCQPATPLYRVPS